MLPKSPGLHAASSGATSALLDEFTLGSSALPLTTPSVPGPYLTAALSSQPSSGKSLIKGQSTGSPKLCVSSSTDVNPGPLLVLAGWLWVRVVVEGVFLFVSCSDGSSAGALATSELLDVWGIGATLYHLFTGTLQLHVCCQF